MWCTWQIGCGICDADLYFNFWVWRIHKIDPKNFSSTYFSYPIKTFLDFFFNLYIYNIRLALITKTDLDYQGWVFVILILNEKKVWNEINTKTKFIHQDFYSQRFHSLVCVLLIRTRLATRRVLTLLTKLLLRWHILLKPACSFIYMIYLW